MNFNNIPEEMRAMPNWSCYKTYTDKEGKRKKIIISPKDGKFAKSNLPETWADFDTAKRYCLRYRYAGLIFALAGGITFIDIDHAVDKTTGKILSPDAEKLMKLFPDTFTERSVSGTGIHILVKGSLPENTLKRNDAKGLEMYDKYRFICMTGDLLSETTRLKDCSDTITQINYDFIGKKQSPVHTPTFGKSSREDSELIDKILQSRQGDKFRRLLGGDTGGYPSHSNADYAMCSILSWWTNDYWQIDRIFRGSGLYRDKWDSPRGSGTYGSNMIESVMSARPQSVFRFSGGCSTM